MSNVLQKLTEGIVSRNVAKEGEALLNKWSNTGLLEGLESDHQKQSMACLLENQAKELLREANTMKGGSAEGFSAVAFPIVRRVFGGLLANDIVSVQPMSLPSGLIFFLDFTHGGDGADPAGDVGPHEIGTSLHGGGKVAKGIAEGVSLSDGNTGFYNLNTGYSTAQGATNFLAGAAGGNTDAAFKVTRVGKVNTDGAGGNAGAGIGAVSGLTLLDIDNDADILSAAVVNGAGTDTDIALIEWSSGVDPDISLSVGTAHTGASGASNNILQIAPGAESSIYSSFGGTGNQVVRRLTKVYRVPATNLNGAATGLIAGDANPNAGEPWKITMVLMGELSGIVTDPSNDPANASANSTLDAAGAKDDYLVEALDLEYSIADNFNAASATGGVVGATAWALEDASMPEIDIKVDSLAITAETRKLKAKWTPELGQDLNAYHNLDAEVELTSILSEQIALEIDKEILGDLVNGATAGVLRWSRLPGRIANADGTTSAAGTVNFTGNVSEWYETLVETVNDASAAIHRKTLRGGANFIVCGPEVANILEFTSGFRASVTHDADRGTVGGVKEGSLNKKWDLYVDPYFPRNLVLVGRKGSSFLESGYVYAPYVPLQTTPTVFDPDTLTPRKGVMTRYGKKMVRPDMYATVLIHDL